MWDKLANKDVQSDAGTGESDGNKDKRNGPEEKDAAMAIKREAQKSIRRKILKKTPRIHRECYAILGDI